MRYRFLRFPGGKAKAFTMSYDDGVRADIRLAEICCKYGVKCTFNLNSGMMHSEPGHRRLCADEIREHLLGRGHEIAVHCFNHQAPGAATPISTMQEVYQDRLNLETTFGGIVRGMAYPDSGVTKIHPGTSYERIRQVLQELGIVYARSLGGDNDRFLLPEDFRKYAGIDQEVIFLGQAGRAEIWAAERYEAEEEKYLTPEAIAAVMEELGF